VAWSSDAIRKRVKVMKVERTGDLSGDRSVAWSSDAIRKMTNETLHTERLHPTCHHVQPSEPRDRNFSSTENAHVVSSSDDGSRRANDTLNRGLASHKDLQPSMDCPRRFQPCQGIRAGDTRSAGPQPKYLPPENQSLAKPRKTVLMMMNYFSRELNTEFAA
jgi:hypothetical protein